MKTLTFTAALTFAGTLVAAEEPASAKPGPANTNLVAAQAVDPDLAAARKKLVVLRARHGEKHPDVQKQLRLIAELQKRSRAQTPSTAADKPSELEAAKQELASLRERYTDQHPLVKNQQRRVAELERQ